MLKLIFRVIVGIIAAALLLLVLYVIFIILPVTLYTEAECLKAGYPKYKVSVGLERYCVTLDGAVTVKVDKQ